MEMELMCSAASTRINHVLITGPPGIGKTTVCRKVSLLLENSGINCNGFLTEERRSLSGNKRIGFDIVPLTNPENRLPLARATQVLDPNEHLATKHRVGNYAVFVKNLETISTPIFQKNSDVLLIDEIGKMELLSELFADKINELMTPENMEGNKCNRCILATIPEVFPGRLTLLKKLRSNPHCKILQVNYNNRNNLPEEITKIICHIIKNKL